MSAGQEGGFKTIFSYHSGVNSISRKVNISAVPGKVIVFLFEASVNNY